MYEIINSAQDFPLFLKQYERSISLQRELLSYYSPAYLAYYSQRFRDQGLRYTDASFVLIRQNFPIFTFLGSIIYNDDGTLVLSYFERPAVSFLSVLNSETVNLVFKTLDEILPDVDAISYHCRPDSGYLSPVDSYFLERFRASISHSLSRIINLRSPLDEIRSSFRKSYKPLVNKSISLFSPTIYDHTNIRLECVSLLRALHICASGYQTRSSTTWLMQYQAILADQAFLILSYLNGRAVSGAFFNSYMGHVYYAVSASDRNMFKLPLSHGIIYQAILYAKSRNFHSLELGQDFTLTTNHHHCNKEFTISVFKRGFGGSLYHRLSFS